MLAGSDIYADRKWYLCWKEVAFMPALHLREFNKMWYVEFIMVIFFLFLFLFLSLSIYIYIYIYIYINLSFLVVPRGPPKLSPAGKEHILVRGDSVGRAEGH
jgi:hypothetical protein